MVSLKMHFYSFKSTVGSLKDVFKAPRRNLRLVAPVFSLWCFCVDTVNSPYFRILQCNVQGRPLLAEMVSTCYKSCYTVWGFGTLCFWRQWMNVIINMSNLQRNYSLTVVSWFKINQDVNKLVKLLLLKRGYVAKTSGTVSRDMKKIGQ